MESILLKLFYNDCSKNIVEQIKTEVVKQHCKITFNMCSLTGTRTRAQVRGRRQGYKIIISSLINMIIMYFGKEYISFIYLSLKKYDKSNIRN
jgi:hypothetical protein